MSSIWFTSDSHFGHEKFLTFKNEAGEFIRPFSSVEEMDERMIDAWNAHVQPGDKVYHLGDFAFVYDVEPYMKRLRGKKRLILGNHDNVKKQKLIDHFEVQMWRIFKAEGFVCTHVPIMRDNFEKVKLNVHGHIHQQPAADENHMNICVEVTDYRPIHMDEIKQAISDRGL